MLHCIYHFDGNMELVNDEEKDRMLATGTWFDHILKAREHKKMLEQKELTESKLKKHKTKLEEDNNEK